MKVLFRFTWVVLLGLSVILAACETEVSPEPVLETVSPSTYRLLAPPCELTGTWNGQRGENHSCDTNPSNCYTCEPIGSGGGSSLRTIKSAFDSGEDGLQDFFLSNEGSNFFFGIPAHTIKVIKTGAFIMEKEEHPDGTHYIVYSEGGKALVSIIL